MLSRHTVQTHVSNILTKLQLGSRIEIVRTVAENAAADEGGGAAAETSAAAREPLRTLLRRLPGKTSQPPEKTSQPPEKTSARIERPVGVFRYPYRKRLTEL